MISAVVLTRNEEKNITDCLKSLLWCDEILVVDDMSTDHTVELARRLSPKVRVIDRLLNNNYAAKRNFALTQTRNEWILFVDADERLSNKLAEEIKRHIAIDRVNGFRLRRQDFFLGKKLRFGETASVRLLRLARRNTGLWQRPVHEFWEIVGPTSTLRVPIDHYPHPTLSHFLVGINRYTDLDAKEFVANGVAFSFPRVILNPLGKFLQNYFLRLGFLDGLPGLIMAFMMSFYSAAVRVKFYELTAPSR